MFYIGKQLISTSTLCVCMCVYTYNFLIKICLWFYVSLSIFYVSVCLCISLFLFSMTVPLSCTAVSLVYNAVRPGKGKEKQLKQMARSLLLTNVALHEDKGFFVLLMWLRAREKKGIRIL